jgi:hypothetical protein
MTYILRKKKLVLKLAIALFISAMAILAGTDLSAQPSSYCNPDNATGWTYYYCFPTYDYSYYYYLSYFK